MGYLSQKSAYLRPDLGAKKIILFDVMGKEQAVWWRSDAANMNL